MTVSRPEDRQRADRATYFPPPVNRPFSFVTSLVASFGGATVTVMEFLQGASLFLGCVGACFAIGGGYYALRIKKLEWEQKSRAARDGGPH